MNITFRKLEYKDLPDLHGWLVSGHVSAGYGGAASKTQEEIYAKYAKRIDGLEPAKGYIFQIDGQDAGYIQVYLYADYPEYNAVLQADDQTAGVDLFIGNKMYIHKGCGKYILSAFLKEIVFTDIRFKSCIMGPDPQNTAGVKTYEKVGFKWIKTIAGSEGEEYIMRLDKKDFTPLTDGVR